MKFGDKVVTPKNLSIHEIRGGETSASPTTPYAVTGNILAALLTLPIRHRLPQQDASTLATSLTLHHPHSHTHALPLA